MEKYSFTVEDDADGLSYNFRTPLCTVVVVFNPGDYEHHLDKYPFLLKDTWGLSIFSIPHLPGGNFATDIRIRNTIVSIVEDFFNTQGNDAVILYHCDYADGKQGKRSKKFERWYQSSGLVESIEKHEIELSIELDDNSTRQNFFGFITLRSNPHFAEVENEFNDFARSLAFLDK